MTYLSVMRDPDPGAAHELEVTDKFAADDTRAGATAPEAAKTPAEWSSP